MFEFALAATASRNYDIGDIGRLLEYWRGEFVVGGGVQATRRWRHRRLLNELVAQARACSPRSLLLLLCLASTWLPVFLFSQATATLFAAAPRTRLRPAQRVFLDMAVFFFSSYNCV